MPDAEFPFRAPGRERARLPADARARAWRIPTPPPMRNHGNHVASICEVVRWLGEKAEALGRQPLHRLPRATRCSSRGRACVGVRTTPTGLKRDGTPGPGRAAADRRRGEGDRALRGDARAAHAGVDRVAGRPLAPTRRSSRSASRRSGRRSSRSTPSSTRWAGRSRRARSAARSSTRWSRTCVALGLVVGLDAPTSRLDVHALLQRMKTHPLFRAAPRGRRVRRVGGEDDPRGRLVLAARAAPRRRRRWCSATRRGSWTWRRSRASTTR